MHYQVTFMEKISLKNLDNINKMLYNEFVALKKVSIRGALRRALTIDRVNMLASC